MIETPAYQPGATAAPSPPATERAQTLEASRRRRSRLYSLGFWLVLSLVFHFTGFVWSMVSLQNEVPRTTPLFPSPQVVTLVDLTTLPDVAEPTPKVALNPSQTKAEQQDGEGTPGDQEVSGQPPAWKPEKKEVPWLLNNKLNGDHQAVGPQDAHLLANQAATTRHAGDVKPNQMGAGVMDRPELPQPFMTHVAMDGAERLSERKDLDALPSDRDPLTPDKEMAAARFASPLQAQRRELMSQDTQRPTQAHAGSPAPAPPPAPGVVPSLPSAAGAPPPTTLAAPAQVRVAPSPAQIPEQQQSNRQAPPPNPAAPSSPPEVSTQPPIAPAPPEVSTQPPIAPAPAEVSTKPRSANSAPQQQASYPSLASAERSSAPPLPTEGVPLAEPVPSTPAARQASPARAQQAELVKSDGSYTSNAATLSFLVVEDPAPKVEQVALLSPPPRADKKTQDPLRPEQGTKKAQEAPPAPVTEAKTPPPAQAQEEKELQPSPQPEVALPLAEKTNTGVPPREEVNQVPPSPPTQVANTTSAATPPRAVRSGGSEQPRPQEGEGGRDQRGRSAPTVSDDVLRNLSAQSGLPVTTLMAAGVSDVDAVTSPYYAYFADVYRQAQRSLDKYLKQNPYFAVELGAAYTDVIVVIGRDGKLEALTLSRKSGTALDGVAQDTVRRCRFRAFPDVGGYPDFLVVRIRVKVAQG